MCFGNKSKPDANQQAESGPRQVPASDPRRASQAPASGSRRASQAPTSDLRRASQALASDPRRASQAPASDSRRASQGPASDPRRASQRASRRRSGVPAPMDANGDSPELSQERRTEKRRSRYITPGSDGEIIIAVMGVTGRIQSLFITCINWLR